MTRKNKIELLYKIFVICIILFNSTAYSQPAPAEEENIPYLMTFGKNAKTSYGDDDFSQTFYFSIPEAQKTPFYIRIFDPDVGGKIDEVRGGFNTKTKYEIYGGRDVLPREDKSKINPVGNYKSGILITSKTFGISVKYDSSWYAFGPFNPAEGALIPELGGYIFKVIAEGIAGDDGNLYKYFLSKSGNENIPIEGGNSFTYEYSFRLHDKKGSVSHIYPFIDEKVIKVIVNIFDFDNDGYIRVISTVKRGLKINKSGEDNWAVTKLDIVDEERKASLDIQLIKLSDAKNNNTVIYITNQYGGMIPFYTIPIGGVPKYSYKINVKYNKKN